LAGRLPSRIRRGAEPPSQPHGRALTHDVPPLALVVRPGDNTRPGGCPAAPRVRSRSCEDRHCLRCAIPRKLPRRDLRSEHPGPESRVGKGRGYFTGAGRAAPIEPHRGKGDAAVRQIDCTIWGVALSSGTLTGKADISDTSDIMPDGGLNEPEPTAMLRRIDPKPQTAKLYALQGPTSFRLPLWQNLILMPSPYRPR
jgi:hypothetical protein